MAAIDRDPVAPEPEPPIGRLSRVVALAQTALSRVDSESLTAAGLRTLLEGLSIDRGVALGVLPDGGVRVEAAIGLGPLSGHCEPADDAHGRLLALTVDAGGCLLLGRAKLAALAADGLPLVAGMGVALATTLRDGSGRASGLLAVAAAEAGAIGAQDVAYARAIADLLGTALACAAPDEELARPDLYDALTGLACRAVFETRLQQALERGRGATADAAILVIDLDGFGKLNEAFGHAVGDEVLAGVAARIAAALPANAFAGRLAGDEFAALIPKLDCEADALAIAATIGAAIGEPALAGEREMAVTASIGVQLTGAGAGGVSELLRSTRAAAVLARERGGDRAELATQGVRRRLAQSADIEQGLRRALSQGELRLRYQPILDLQSATIVAVEAFVRWQHPDRGLLGPGEFVAVADASGLAVALGAEILSIACAELARWRLVLPAGSAPAVHVNVSARHFAAADLVGSVARALARSGLPPGRLVLELAETLFAGEGRLAQTQLEDLRGLGVRIALDRFGTGGAPLSALRTLPLDGLKVDSSFLTELGNGTRDARLVQAMIGIGHSLGLPTTAAKVETEEQLRRLRSLGLDRAQGELFASPLSPDAALELVRSGRAWASLLEATRPPQRPAAGAVTETAGGDAASAEVARSPEQVAHAQRVSAISPSDPPRRPLLALADLAEGHGPALAHLSWRDPDGELTSGFFAHPASVDAAERWIGALSSAAATGNYERLDEATRTLMEAAERGGASAQECSVALERFGATTSSALTRRGASRAEVADTRRLFAFLDQRVLAASK